MYEKSKTELLAMSIEEIETHERDVWDYFSKVKKVMNFMKLED